MSVDSRGQRSEIRGQPPHGVADRRPLTSDLSHDDLHAQADIAEAQAHAAMLTTHVLGPRHRVFLPQTRRDRARGFWWSIVRASLFRWSLPSATGWRNMLLRVFGAKIAQDATVAASAHIDHPWNLTMECGVVVCDHAIINCMGAVTIGEGTRISQYAHVCAGTHEYQRPDMRIQPRPITLGRDVWIAADAFVGPGVNVGEGAMLAARSAAFHDLPGGMICLGEPARVVKPRG
jgi:putative colanic acid biosynthesis acetyltransferase WcaF